MKLAIAQMVLGVLIGVILFCGNWLSWEGSSSLEWARMMSRLVLCVPLLGVAVLGCGIAQYLKARVK